MTKLLQSLLDQLSGSMLTIGVALVILVLGWIVALLVGWVVRGVVRRTKIDARMKQWLSRDEGEPVDASRAFGKAAYYIVMLFVLGAFFQRLGLTFVTGPINALLTALFEFAPSILGAGIILLVAWIVASILRFVITKALNATNFDERLRKNAALDDGEASVSSSLGDAVFWLVFLLFMPAVLGVVGMDGLVAPVQGLFDDLLGYIPSVLGAGVILLVGWFAARIVRQILTNVLAAAGIDRWGERLNLGDQKLSALIGTVVNALVMIQVAIAALDALNIDSISGPATTMLGVIWGGIPGFVGAIVVLGVSFYIGRWIGDLVSGVLAGVGFNRVLFWIGLGQEPGEGQQTPSDIVGYLVLVGVMLLASVEAAGFLGFDIVAELVATVLGYSGQALVAVVILGVGMYLANVARNLIQSTSVANARILGRFARITIMVLVVALTLGQLGVASEIVNLAFGLLLGAVAVAIALAFGLGGRDIAARKVEDWLQSFEEGEKTADMVGSGTRSTPGPGASG